MSVLTSQSENLPATSGDAAQGNGNAIIRRAPIEEREVTYTPFQSADKITLTAGMVIKFLCKPTKRGFSCSAEHAVRFMMLCKARSLNPWEGDAYLVGYDGQDGPEFNLITAHQAFLKRAEAHTEFEGMESGVMLIDSNAVITETQGDFIPPGFQLVGGWAKVYRKDRKIPCYRRLNLNVFNKGYSQWKANPQGMIVKVAEADALRSSFPNSLAGMYADGEVDTTSRQVESQVQAAPASRVDQLLKKVTSGPVSEGRHLEPTPEALAEAAQDATPATQTNADANPADTTSDASPVAGASGQAEEPAKENIPVRPPPQGYALDHGKWLDAMMEAAVDLKVPESDLQAYIVSRFGPDIFAKPAAQKAAKPGDRAKAFTEFVSQNGGELVAS